MGLTNECPKWIQTQQNQSSKKKHPAGLQVDIFKTWGVQSPFLIKFEGRSSSKANIGKQSKHLKSIELSRARGLNLPNLNKILMEEDKPYKNEASRLKKSFKGFQIAVKTKDKYFQRAMCLPDFITKQADPTAILDFQLKEVILPAIEIELNRFPILQEIKQDIKEMDQKITGMEQDITGMKQDITGMKQDITGMKQDITGMKQDITGMKQDITGIKNTLSDGFGLMSQSLVLHGNILQKLWVDPSEKEELKKSNQKLNDFKGANIHFKNQDLEDGDKH